MNETQQGPVFYAVELGSAGDVIELTSDEARHAAGARRLRDGDPVVVMNALGQAVAGRLQHHGRKTQVIVSEALPDEPMPATRVHLAAAIPRGDRLSTLLDMTTQIGLTSFTPLICDRSSGRLPGAERLERIMIGACKQSRRFRMPTLNESASLSTVLAAHDPSHPVFIAHPGGESLHHSISVDVPVHYLVLIGPEGGFTEAEVTLAKQQGATAVSLGDYILRIETACAVALALLQQRRLT